MNLIMFLDKFSTEEGHCKALQDNLFISRSGGETAESNGSPGNQQDRAPPLVLLGGG